MLRLLHAFCEAAPMLLLQLYLLISRDPVHPPSKPFIDLNVVSVALSLFSVCWALASFSKNVRLQNVHRLVLTWLGVIFQVWLFSIFMLNRFKLVSPCSFCGVLELYRQELHL